MALSATDEQHGLMMKRRIKMKKQIIAVTAISAVLCLTGCGADITITSAPQNDAVSVSTTSDMQENASPMQDHTTTPAANITPTETQAVTPEAQETASVRIDSAEIVAVGSREGDGYMFRLDVTGAFAYWTAEITETSAGTTTTYSVSGKEMTAEKPYFSGGSTVTDMRAVITPFDTVGKAGASFSAVWDTKRVIMPDAIHAKVNYTVEDSCVKQAFSAPNGEGYILYQCKVPYFTCDNPDAAITENLNMLNEHLRQIMIHPIREYEALGYQDADFDKAKKAVDASPIGHEQTETNYFLIDQGNVCTVMLSSDWYGGGAHGGHSLNTVLFDAAQMKLIRNLNEISAAPNDFISFAADYFMEHYAEKYAGKTDWNADYLKQALTEGGTYYFQNDTFYIQFPEYSFDAIYAEGPQVLEIPLAQCMPHFNDYGKQLFQ